MPPIREIRGYIEVTGTCNLNTFWQALELNWIGTPVKQLLASSSEFRVWVTDLLISFDRENDDSELPSELIKGLELERLRDERVSSLRGAEQVPIKAAALIRT